MDTQATATVGITEYRLQVEESWGRLSARVTQMLSEGWRLYGNPTMMMGIDTGGDYHAMAYQYAQAMVR